ncbi:glucans biosynthesis protein [Pseudodesulfovibrio hydrargyri]|uniref:Glucans biosynthesis protein n=1 Tax=Pseudodesulfovibrio hydrargyri TaxID=2125990 RepID=A0A1J5N758_9BACT|nr:acyltransferase [Pseudodesulfovibrio hydrargyri]OIQ49135.1 glucans biosynthesis protein [Pseudodesulfovibrio hydrargyri]
MDRPGHPGKGDRDLSIDIAKVFGIMLVVMAHSQSPFPLEKMITSFTMTVFYMISGLLYKPRGVAHALRNKLSTLVVPYFMAAIVTLPTLWAIGQGSLFNTDIVFRLLDAKDEGLVWNSPLWFLPSLFITIVAFSLLEAALRSTRAAALAGIVLGLAASYLVLPVRPFLFFGLDTAVPGLAFFSLGVLVSGRDSLRNPSPRWNLAAFALCFGLWVATRMLGGHPYFIMAKYRISPNLLFFATGIAGTFATLYFARFLDLIWKQDGSGLPARLLLFLSSSMFGIYVFHKPIINSIRDYVPPLGGLRFLVLFIAGVTISSLLLALLRVVSPRLTRALTGSR